VIGGTLELLTSPALTEDASPNSAGMRRFVALVTVGGSGVTGSFGVTERTSGVGCTQGGATTLSVDRSGR